MHAQIGLTVSIKVERAQWHRSGYRMFEDAGIDGLALVDRQPRTRDVE